jgi:glycosyltransferase involved in cell wall biosynthesis
LWHRNQILVIHDANVWDFPEGFDSTYRRFHQLMRPLLARRILACATVSHAAARSLAPRLGCSEQSLHIIPNGAGHIAATPPDPAALTRFGLTPGKYLLAVGNQSPNKNLARLAAAHAQAMVVDPGLPVLAIVGGFAPGVASAALAPRPGLNLLGRVSDGALRALYDGASAFVWPALSEGFGIPPLEAMQLGCPVLSSNTSAMPEVLGDAPLWFDPTDVSDMARALLEFRALDSAERGAMAARGRLRAESFSWQFSAQSLLRVTLS